MSNTNPLETPPNISLSQSVADARLKLLKNLQAQLDPLLAQELTPQAKGVPFINIKHGPPQIEAIKKVINCMYYSEKALIVWEQVEKESTWEKAKAVPQGIWAINELHKSLALLDNVSPEIRSIIVTNYQFLAPVFSQAFEIVNSTSWFAEFNKMESTEKANKVIAQGIDLLRPGYRKDDEGNSLVAAFNKVSAIMEVILLGQKKDLTSDEINGAIEEFCKLLVDLDNNMLFRKYSYEYIEHTNGFKEFMNWVKVVQEEGIKFNHNSLKKYIAFTNENLPKMMLFLDQLEQQNYLNHGQLSSQIASPIDRISKEANDQLRRPPYYMTEKIITTDSLALQRDSAITQRQIISVEKILYIMEQQAATKEFYAIIERYENNKLSNITEKDRLQLIRLYPNVQLALAHADLALENELTKILKQPGSNEENQSTWDYLISIVHLNGADLLDTKESVTGFMAAEIQAEELKIKVAERAREQITQKEGKAITKSFTERVELRVEKLQASIVKAVPIEPGVREQLNPIGISELKNIRGNFAYLQKLKLSETVNGTKALLAKLIPHHLDSNQARFLSAPPPYSPEANDTEEVQQLKKLMNSLYNLELFLITFEQQDINSGLYGQLKFLYKVKDSALELWNNVNSLKPAYKQHIAPLVEQITILSDYIHKINAKAPGLEDLQKLKQPKITDFASDIKIAADKGMELSGYPFNQVYDPYIDKIKCTRNALVARCKATLADPIASRLNQQEEGVPFVDFENDPPQVESIKKIVNALYAIEVCCDIWQSRKTNMTTTIDKLIYAQQAVALSVQLYHSFALFNSAPEVQTLISDNYDLLAPVYAASMDLINQTGWACKLQDLDIPNTSGHFIGQGVNLLQPSQQKAKFSSPIVDLLTQLPLALNTISGAIDEDTKLPLKELKIKTRKIEELGSVFELLFSSDYSFFAITNIPSAISTFKELSTKITTQNTQLQNTTVSAYQEWMEQYYPLILKKIDAIETEFNFKPGTLSKAIIAEIDPINDKVNETIESMNKKLQEELKDKTKGISAQKPLKNIPLSTDLTVLRAIEHQKREHNIRIEQHKIEQQHNAVNRFFGICVKYQGSVFANIHPKDAENLAQLFAKIQEPLSNTNLELANKLVLLFKKQSQAPMDVDQILLLEPQVKGFLNQQLRSLQLKMEVLDDALVRLGPLKPTQEQNRQLNELLAPINIEPDTRVINPADLKVLSETSLSHARGNLSYLQDLKLSEVSVYMKDEFAKLTKTFLSDRVLPYLDKPKDEALHIIKPDDPNLIRQIKKVENSLTKFNLAFVNFEQMNRSKSMVFQAQAFIVLRQQVFQLVDTVLELPPDLQAHYEPIINEIKTFCQKLQSVEYNKQDLAELQALLLDTKEELLKKKSKEAKVSQVGFFKRVNTTITSMIHKPAAEKALIDDNVNRPENTKELRKRALKLGGKYLHLASPELEHAKKVLRERFNSVDGPDQGELGSLPRHILSDREYMQNEIDRLTKVLNKRFGFNWDTCKALKNILDQSLRVGAEVDELGNQLNVVIKNDYIIIKDMAYEDFIFLVSQREDDLGLKAGTILKPAMSVINQFFLSVALELDMPFEHKIELFHEARFLNILIQKTQASLDQLIQEQAKNPLNIDIPLTINLTKDKLSFLNERLHSAKERSADQEALNTLKSTLLDNQFEVGINKLFKKLEVLPPIADHLYNELHKQYTNSKTRILLMNPTQINSALDGLVSDYTKQTQADYILLSKGYQMLERLKACLPDHHENVVLYLQGITDKITNEEVSLEIRANIIKNLPDDPTFIHTMNSVTNTPDFLVLLTRFIQFVELVVSSIYKAATTGADFMKVYNQKKLNQTIDNMDEIEKQYAPVPEVKEERSEEPSDNVVKRIF